jgi:hypothetical protein
MGLATETTRTARMSVPVSVIRPLLKGKAYKPYEFGVKGLGRHHAAA